MGGYHSGVRSDEHRGTEAIMTTQKKLLACGILVLLVVAYWFVTQRLQPILDRWFAPHLSTAQATLKPSEQEKFMVSEHYVTTVKRDTAGKTQVSTEYVPKRATIIVNKDGTVSVKPQRFGFGYEPGLGIGYGDALRIAPNLKVVYFDRFGLNVGASFKVQGHVDGRLFVAGSYNFASNTSLFVGIDHRKDLIGGLSVSF